MEEITTIPEMTGTTLNSLVSSWRHAMLYVAWGQALIATIGSLSFSEVLGYAPCSLCWYQRILMYPLVIILAVGIVRRDSQVRSYVLPLSGLGFAIALYHNLLYFGFISEDTIRTCTAGVSCSTRWFEWFGFISIPQLSLIAFTVINMAVLWYREKGIENEPGSEAIEGQHPDKPASPTISVQTLFLSASLVLSTGMMILGMMKNVADATGKADSGSLNIGGTSLPTVSNNTMDANTDSPALISEGRAVFSRTCVACHSMDAQGIPNLGPNLIGNAFIRDATDAALRTLIANGRQVNDPMNKTGQVMPAKGGNPTLTSEQVSALIAYLRSLNRN